MTDQFSFFSSISGPFFISFIALITICNYLVFYLVAYCLSSQLELIKVKDFILVHCCLPGAWSGLWLDIKYFAWYLKFTELQNCDSNPVFLWFLSWYQLGREKVHCMISILLEFQVQKRKDQTRNPSDNWFQAPENPCTSCFSHLFPWESGLSIIRIYLVPDHPHSVCH